MSHVFHASPLIPVILSKAKNLSLSQAVPIFPPAQKIKAPIKETFIFLVFKYPGLRYPPFLLLLYCIDTYNYQHNSEKYINHCHSFYLLNLISFIIGAVFSASPFYGQKPGLFVQLYLLYIYFFSHLLKENYEKWAENPQTLAPQRFPPAHFCFKSGRRLGKKYKDPQFWRVFISFSVFYFCIHALHRLFFTLRIVRPPTLAAYQLVFSEVGDVLSCLLFIAQKYLIFTPPFYRRAADSASRVSRPDR